MVTIKSRGLNGGRGQGDGLNTCMLGAVGLLCLVAFLTASVDAQGDSPQVSAQASAQVQPSRSDQQLAHSLHFALSFVYPPRAVRDSSTLCTPGSCRSCTPALVQSCVVFSLLVPLYAAEMHQTQISRNNLVLTCRVQVLRLKGTVL